MTPISVLTYPASGIIIANPSTPNNPYTYTYSYTYPYPTPTPNPTHTPTPIVPRTGKKAQTAASRVCGYRKKHPEEPLKGLG